jgi:hypothetical protein
MVFRNCLCESWLGCLLSWYSWFSSVLQSNSDIVLYSIQSKIYFLLPVVVRFIICESYCPSCLRNCQRTELNLKTWRKNSLLRQNWKRESRKLRVLHANSCRQCTLNYILPLFKTVYKSGRFLDPIFCAAKGDLKTFGTSLEIWRCAVHVISCYWLQYKFPLPRYVTPWVEICFNNYQLNFISSLR